MESHHDRAGGAILSIALALIRYGKLENAASVIIFVAHVEGERRIFPRVSSDTAERHLFTGKLRFAG
jgi:hypothetical protein